VRKLYIRVTGLIGSKGFVFNYYSSVLPMKGEVLEINKDHFKVTMVLHHLTVNEFDATIVGEHLIE